MDETDSERELNTLDARLKQARKAQKGHGSQKTRLRGENSGFGQAMRLGAELISALVVGTGIGWFLDRWLDTKPALMIVFIFLGGAAGILNVYRTAMQMAAEAQDDAQQRAQNGAFQAAPKDSGKKDGEK